jgi:hypothetical protein
MSSMAADSVDYRVLCVQHRGRGRLVFRKGERVDLQSKLCAACKGSVSVVEIRLASISDDHLGCTC